MHWQVSTEARLVHNIIYLFVLTFSVCKDCGNRLSSDMELFELFLHEGAVVIN